MSPQPSAIRKEISRLESALEATPNDAEALEALLDAEERLVKAEAYWFTWARKENGPNGAGPRYPKLAGLEKYRKAAKKGTVDVQAYGEAVGEAIKALQRKEAETGLYSSRPCQCASGTWHSEAADIQRAVRAQHEAALHRQFVPLDKAKWQRQMAEKYRVAMLQKRARVGAVERELEPA